MAGVTVMHLRDRAGAVEGKSKFAPVVIVSVIDFDLEMDWQSVSSILPTFLNLTQLLGFSSNTFFCLTPKKVTLSLQSNGTHLYHLIITSSLMDRL